MTRHHDVINPATEEVVTTVELLDAERHRRRDRPRRARRSQSWRAVAPGRPRPAAAPLRRGGRRATARTWPSSRSPTPATRSATPAGRPATSATCIAYYSGAPERLIGQQIPVADGIDVTFHEPLGVVGVIVPWNFPMPIASWGFAPALAAGNTVVLKPAELTPLTAIRLAELALEAGLPAGRLPGAARQGQRRRAAVRRLIRTSRKIVFTGSTEVGRQVMAGCARAGQAGDPRARRQERQRRLRRRRPRARPRPPRRTRCSTTPGRTAAPARASWSSAAPTTGSWSCSRPAVRGVVVDRPGRRERRDGAADQRGAARPGRRPTSPDDAPVAFRGSAPDGPGFWFPPTVLAPDRPRRPGRCTRRSSARSSRCVPFDDEADAIRDRQRQRLRPVRLDLDPRRRPGDPGQPGHRVRQPVGQLALVGALLDAVRRLQVLRARPRARARTRRSPSPRPRTSSSATDSE